MNEVKQIKTITQEALQFLKDNPHTVAKVAVDLDRAQGTLLNWISSSPEKFTAPAALRIIARDMGKRVSEITEPVTTKTVA